MRNYCPNVDDMVKILQWREHGEPIECSELALEIDGAQCWTTRIVCITLFFARILERDRISVEALKERIEALYSMTEEFWFEIQEINDCFIEYLLRHLRNRNDSLENSLIEIQNGLSEYNYEKAIRY